MTSDAVDIREAFVDYLKQAPMLVNTPAMQELSVALYRLLSRGLPVTREQLAVTCGFPPERIAQLLDGFLPSALEFDARGDVVAFGGLSLRPTRHRLVTGEIELHTWCVFDALFLPEILDKPGILITHCPASRAELTVDLGPGEIRGARPSDPVMSIVAPDRQACCDDLRGAFCNHVNLFRDSQTFGAWSGGRKDLACVTLEVAEVFAWQRNAWRYPEIRLRA